MTTLYVEISIVGYLRQAGGPDLSYRGTVGTGGGQNGA